MSVVSSWLKIILPTTNLSRCNWLWNRSLSPLCVVLSERSIQTAENLVWHLVSCLIQAQRKICLSFAMHPAGCLEVAHCCLQNLVFPLNYKLKPLQSFRRGLPGRILLYHCKIIYVCIIQVWQILHTAGNPIPSLSPPTPDQLQVLNWLFYVTCCFLGLHAGDSVLPKNS